jgi:hypothetical protein
MPVIDAEIRTWAKEQGMEVGERGRIPKEVLRAWESGNVTPASSYTPPAEPDFVDEEGEVVDAPAVGEAKPARAGLRDRFQRAASSKVGAGLPGQHRVTAEPLLGSAWQMAAAGLVMSGADIPVGRCMMLQAPAAGALLDTALAGTLPDKLLIQPMAKAGARGANLSALLGPPLIIGLIERQPALYEPLKPILKGLLTAYLVETWPQVKKMRDQEAKAMEILAEMAGEDMPDVDTLLDNLFAPPPRGPVQEDGYVPEEVMTDGGG